MTYAVWGPFPAEWGAPPPMREAVPAEIRRRAEWIRAHETRPARRSAPAAELRTAPGGTLCPEALKLRLAVEAKRADPEQDVRREALERQRALYRAPLGRELDGAEALAMLNARGFAPVSRPGAVGQALLERAAAEASQYARNCGRRGWHRG